MSYMEEKTKIATRQSYGEKLAELGEKNKNIVVLDADLSGATKTNIFAKKFPDRFIDVGIAEQNMFGIAAGLSTYGKYLMQVLLLCLPLEELMIKLETVFVIQN